MTGKGNRRKGARIEHEIVRMHTDVCPAKKVSRTGYTGHDLDVADTFKAEVKARKNGAGFATLDKWLGENDLLFLRRNHARPTVVMPWRTYAALMRAYADALQDATQGRQDARPAVAPDGVSAAQDAPAAPGADVDTPTGRTEGGP